MKATIERLREWNRTIRASGLSDLLEEAASKLEEMEQLREQDAHQMSALIAGYQRMQAACIDGTECQVPSQINVTQDAAKPFAWAADIPGKFGAAPTVLFGYTEKLVQRIAAAGGDVVKPFPLYRQSQTCPHVVGITTQYCSLTPFTLADEERDEIEGIVSDFKEIAEFNEERCHPHYAEKARRRAAMLIGLLERLG